LPEGNKLLACAIPIQGGDRLKLFNFCPLARSQPQFGAEPPAGWVASLNGGGTGHLRQVRMRL